MCAINGCEFSRSHGKQKKKAVYPTISGIIQQRKEIVTNKKKNKAVTCTHHVFPIYSNLAQYEHFDNYFRGMGHSVPIRESDVLIIILSRNFRHCFSHKE